MAASFVLLTGAGFTRNWNGYLASEVADKLLGSDHLTPELRRLLGTFQEKGDFEGALAQLQAAYAHTQSAADQERLERFEKAVFGLFLDMNEGLAKTTFEPQNELAMMVRTFLVKFDAIFTLNQDVLLEYHYLDTNIDLALGSKWDTWQIPGMRPQSADYLVENMRRVAWWEPAVDQSVDARRQPYFKLHGSSNWYGEGGKRLLIAGGNKVSSIGRFPVIQWYHEQFKEYLSRPATRLMVIGYGFRDSHINDAIQEAVLNHGLRVYIVDPNGLRVLSPNTGAIGGKSSLQTALEEHAFPLSTRSLLSTFGRDHVEHAHVMKFFHTNPAA